MSKRKPNNPRLRLERYSRAVLGRYRVTVVHMEPSGRQGLIDYKTCLNIGPAPQIAEAITDIAHPWVIYLAGFCHTPSGEQYIKGVEIAVPGVCKSESLADAIESQRREFLANSCNPNHLIGSGWIANPSGVSFSEVDAGRIFAACGAWSTAPQRECA